MPPVIVGDVSLETNLDDDHRQLALKRSNSLVSRVFNTSSPLAQNSLGWPSEKLTRSGSAIASTRDASPVLKHSRNSVFAALIAKRLSMSYVGCSIMT